MTRPASAAAAAIRQLGGTWPVAAGTVGVIIGADSYPGQVRAVRDASCTQETMSLPPWPPTNRCICATERAPPLAGVSQQCTEFTPTWIVGSGRASPVVGQVSSRSACPMATAWSAASSLRYNRRAWDLTVSSDTINAAAMSA